MTFDRDLYFDAVRASLFENALTQQQVDGQNVILAVWEHDAGGTPMTDLRWLAYMLATTFHECATRMWPVTEYGSDDYLQGKEYYPYIARGFVGLTWEANYAKASAALGLIDDRDLVAHPDVALDCLIAARCLFRGCAEGWYTGKRLNDFFNDSEDDAVGARAIVNPGDDAALIAGYHDKFLKALNASLIKAPVPAPLPDGDVRVVLMDISVPQGVEFQLMVNDEYFYWPPVKGT